MIIIFRRISVIKAREAKIELLRFLACIILMNGHSTFLGFNTGRPFMYGWIYVEFFFIVTGYFASAWFASHSDQVNGPVNSIIFALKNTYKKFLPFLAFTTVPIIITHICDYGALLKYGQFIPFLSHLKWLPIEIGYLASAFPEGTIAPLWFMSAMFISFPFFLLILCIKKPKIYVTLAGILAVIVYFFTSFSNLSFPHPLIRAFTGLLLGCIAYNICSAFKKLRSSTGIRITVTVFEVICFLIPLFLSMRNINLPQLSIICFLIWIISLQSGFSFIAPLKSRIILFLGKLSMPLYVWHYCIITVINRFADSLHITYKVVLFWLITFICALANLLIVSSIKSHKKQSHAS